MEEFIEKAVSELQLDKSQWSLTKFGDVTIQQKQSVDRDNTELTRYVKGEHMGSEDLHLREWGELTDEYLGPAFIRKFEEGDILYGSRRTYLRKVVLTPFSGITSNTTFVIKANEKRIDKRLLPFVMMSERFTENSIRNSKGSVNPYINWKDIANFEFLLPPKDQQAQLAELLWAMDEVIEREKEVLNHLKFSYLSVIEKSLIARDAQKIFFKDLVHVVRGVGYKPEQLLDGNDTQSCILLRSNNIFNGSLNYDDINLIPLNLVKSEQFLKEGDFAICMSNGSKELVGKCGEFTGENRKVTIGSFCAALRPKNNDNRRLVRHLVNSESYRIVIKRTLSGSAINNLKPSDIENLFIRIDNNALRSNVLDNLDSLLNNMKSVEIKISSSKSLQKSLINQIF